MAKFQNDSIYDDGTLQYIRLRGNRVVVLKAQSATFAAANGSTQDLLARSSAITSTDYTLANGDTSGRKITVAAQSTVSVIQTATANHVAVISTTASAIMFITTCTTQSVTTGNTVDIPAFDFEQRDLT